MTMTLRIISGGVFLLLAFCVESSLSQGCKMMLCPRGKVCVEDSNGRGSCVCQTICTQEEDPVCGSDGKTYGNECRLLVEACRTNTQITVAHKGKCTGCEVIECPQGKDCVEDSNGKGSCVCPTICTQEEDPVCGSNGKTYGNECKLLVEACRTNTEITVAHKGKCTACDPEKCPDGKVCELDSNGKPNCVCNTGCTKQYDPVCGSNGKTYGNKCMLLVEACTTNTKITVAYKGKCKV